jgi:hypothetical protein
MCCNSVCVGRNSFVNRNGFVGGTVYEMKVAGKKGNVLGSCYGHIDMMNIVSKEE